MSNAPYLLKGARWGYRMGHGEVVDSMLAEGLTCAIEGVPHGHHRRGGRGEVRRRAAPSRTRSPPRASAAPSRRCATGAFADEIVPVDDPAEERARRCACDATSIRAPGTTVEKLAALKPAFKKDGTVTAGNASGINDGAAALVVTTDDVGTRARARRRSARVLAYATVGVEPKFMGMGPVPAVTQGARARRPDASDQIDLFELNEAFAAQSVAVVRELGIDPARVNVHGGAIALGHPIGASGARVLTTLLYALRHRKARYGVASLCIGGGMGVAMVVERI